MDRGLLVNVPIHWIESEITRRDGNLDWIERLRKPSLTVKSPRLSP